jgi:hypothetical protein
MHQTTLDAAKVWCMHVNRAYSITVNSEVRTDSEDVVPP